MRIFISGDIEGITGIVSWSQCEGPTSAAYDFAFARRMYVHDVNAAIRGAKKAGATEVIVKDSHNNCKNLLIDELEPDTELISGTGPTPLGMMEGIDASFDAAMLIGYHSLAGANGTMSHALVGGLHEFWINDIPAGEIMFSAAVAGAFGVPVVTVTSDDLGCAEAAMALHGVCTYAVKQASGAARARLLHPSKTSTGIETTAHDGVLNAKSIPAYKPDLPITMRVRFQLTDFAEAASLVPGVSRLDGYSLEWTCADVLTAAKLAYAVFDGSRAGRMIHK